MTKENKVRIHDIVSVDPDLMHGTPCFRDDLKSGFTIDEFLAGCPTVTRDQVEGYLELAQGFHKDTNSHV